MCLTTAFTVLSGAGTTCVALAAEKFGSMSVMDMGVGLGLCVTFLIARAALFSAPSRKDTLAEE